MQKKTNIKVSVLCPTYNHVEFVRKALDGFLIQVTDFEFEVLINDDASNDGTVEIIKEYRDKYPDKIKPIFHEKNQFSLGKKNMIMRYLMPRAKGKYIALCEGDDYWTDKNKLQTQVDFLEKNPDYALCFHPVKVVFEKGEKPSLIHPEASRYTEFTTRELLKENFIQTNSVMYRSKHDYRNLTLKVMPGDWYLHLYHAQFGKIGFINQTMAVYRRHSEGLWWNAHNNIDRIWELHGTAHMALYLQFLEMYKMKEHQGIIQQHIANLLCDMIRIDSEKETNLVKDVIKQFPEYIPTFITSLYKRVISKDSSLSEKDKKIHELNLEIIKNHKNLEKLNMIKSSRLWNARNRVAKYIGKEVV